MWPGRGPWVQHSHCPDHRAKGGNVCCEVNVCIQGASLFAVFYLSVWFHRDRLDQVGVSTENIAATDLLRFWCGLGLGQRGGRHV